MTHRMNLGILLVSTGHYQQQRLLPYAEAIAKARATYVTCVSFHPDRIWRELPEFLRGWDCDMIVAGWPIHDHEMRELLDLAQQADVVVVRPTPLGDPEIGRILIPWSGKPVAMAGLAMAKGLSDVWQVPCRVLRICRPRHVSWDGPTVSLSYYRRIRDQARLQTKVAGLDLPLKLLVSDDIVGRVLAMARPDDLIVVGAPNDWLIRQYIGTSIPGDIRNSARGPVMMLIMKESYAHRLSDTLWERSIRLGLKADNWTNGIRQLVDGLIDDRQIPWQKRQAIIEQVRQSGVVAGNDAAIAHVVVSDCSQVIATLGVFRDGVPIGGGTLQTFRVLLLLLAPQEHYERYLATVARAAELLSDTNAVMDIAAAGTPAEVHGIIASAESRWPPLFSKQSNSGGKVRRHTPSALK